MNAYRITIEPRGPFYQAPLGRVRKSGAMVHSDTLHAALVDVAALTGSPLVAQAQSLRLSSLFPFWKSVYFYPKPFLPPPGTGEITDPSGRKRWKNVRLVSESLLRAWLAHDTAAVSGAVMHEDGIAMLPQDLAGKSAPPAHFFAPNMVPAVTVDRAGGSTTPYERRSLRLNADGGCGLYLLAMLDEAHVPEFRRVLERLGELGLGGERSVGHGHFDVLGVEPFTGGPGVGRDQADRFLSLSLYLPSRQEVEAGVLQKTAAYDCAIRGGWIHAGAGSAERKRSLRMCVEGSVFPAVSGAPGEVRDCRPASFTAHPVWRSGLAYPLFFKGAAPEGGAT